MKKFIILTAVAILAFPALSSAQKNSAVQTDLVGFYSPKTRTNLNIWYQGDVLAGFAISNKSENTDLSRPFVETTHGIRITKYAFVGAGMGFQYAYGKFDIYNNEKNSPKWNALLIPVFANVKAYCPINDKFSPYLTLSLGGSFVALANKDLYPTKPSGGLYCKLGAGLSYKSLTFDLGLMHQNVDSGYFSNNAFYVNVGFLF